MMLLLVAECPRLLALGLAYTGVGLPDILWHLWREREKSELATEADNGFVSVFSAALTHPRDIILCRLRVMYCPYLLV